MPFLFAEPVQRPSDEEKPSPQLTGNWSGREGYRYVVIPRWWSGGIAGLMRSGSSNPLCGGPLVPLTTPARPALPTPQGCSARHPI